MGEGLSFVKFRSYTTTFMMHSELHLQTLGNPPVHLKYFIKSMYNKILSIYNRNINLDHILYLTQGDIVHNTVLSLQTLQLYCSHLHQERVLIAIKFQQIVIQLGSDAFLVPSIQVSAIIWM